MPVKNSAKMLPKKSVNGVNFYVAPEPKTKINKISEEDEKIILSQLKKFIKDLCQVGIKSSYFSQAFNKSNELELLQMFDLFKAVVK